MQDRKRLAGPCRLILCAVGCVYCRFCETLQQLRKLVFDHELSAADLNRYERPRKHARSHRAGRGERDFLRRPNRNGQHLQRRQYGCRRYIEFEPGLQHDLPAILDKLIPPSRSYGHEQAWHDGNGHSHLQATLLGPSLTIPIAEGQLVLGTWQQIFHLECDVRERQRTILVTVVGD